MRTLLRMLLAATRQVHEGRCALADRIGSIRVAVAFVAIAALFATGPGRADAQDTINNAQLVDQGQDLSVEESAPHSKTVADGLYMSGIWVATYSGNYSSISITLPYIYNYTPYTTGSLRLSYWATTYAPIRGQGINGYRLATFPTMSPLLPYYLYSNIAQSTSMGVPPNGTYWFDLVLEEYDPANCSTADGFCLVDDLISSAQRTFGPTGADLSITQVATPNQSFADKDVVFTLTISNAGPSAASSLTVTDIIDSYSTFIWASPGCSLTGAATVTCGVGNLASGANTHVQVVVRPSSLASTGIVVINSANVSAAESDPHSTDNSTTLMIVKRTLPPGVPVLRYRLYSPVTKEHHFTTDLNEYTVLGTYIGTWVQEGTVGKVLNNPGSFNGVTAIPYYRLYNTSTQEHHWTTDANEYYTLIQFPWWSGEDVDGYILPSNTSGATQLYRLLYPFIAGLHHWTIDPHEYSVLTSSYGWIGEGGAGFVIQ